MIFTDNATKVTIDSKPAEILKPKPLKAFKSGLRNIHSMAWICLLLACVGASWFVYQHDLVPQPKNFLPNWHGAQWIRAVDGDDATAYFRYTTTLKTVPEHAFMMIAASQVFQIYVNSGRIDSSGLDFGSYPRAYMYDITSLLESGTNVIAIQVDNLDRQIPMLRASFGVVIGQTTSYFGTSGSWQATTRANLVYPQNTPIAASLIAWTAETFNISDWSPGSEVAKAPVSPSLIVNPSVYEQPVNMHWLSVGVGQNAYFVRQLFLPEGLTKSWLRIVSTGVANIYINGNLSINWDSQPKTVRQNTVDMVTDKIKVKYIRELSLGIYDVSPYFHTGLNTIAIHVSLKDAKGVFNDQSLANAALSLDMLISDNQQQNTWLNFPAGWRASHLAVPDWIVASNVTLSWASPVNIGVPGGYNITYSSGSNGLTSGPLADQFIPVSEISKVILFSTALVLVSWLLVSLLFMRRYYLSRRAALEAMSIAYIPALALEGFLIVLSNEPQIAHPFPYTRFWGLVLIVMVVVGYGLLWLYAFTSSTRGARASSSKVRKQSLGTNQPQSKRGIAATFSRLLSCLRIHWAVIPVLLLAIPLIFYNMGYESFWQDELVSFDVAKSILHNGLPLLPSGFVYAKAELYSYLLALSMKIFGDQAGATRLLSGIECLLTLLLLYRVGCYFFDRRVALLATVMLALSPQELLWARQLRMYQQAQLLTLLSLYLIYRAVQDRHRVYLVYLAMGALIATYLSHEETFIILPGLAVCVLLAGFATKNARHRLPSIFYQKHWWFATTIAIGVIGLQLVIAKLTHPPVIGTDKTWRPMVEFTTDNIFYYYGMLFIHAASYQAATNQLIIATSILLNSVLAILGCFWARRSNNPRIKYIALFFVLGLLTLVFLFTMQAGRYFYPLATFYYLIGAYALVKMLRAIWVFAGSRAILRKPGAIALVTGGEYHSRPLRILVMLAAVLVCLSVLIMPMLPLDNYNLFVSRVLGFPYYLHYADYQKTGQYVQQNLRKGDIVISIIPDTIVMYYIGQSDYFFSIDHALFLFENKGHVVDTYSGKEALLRQSDLDTVLSMHTRIWLISSNNSYQNGVLKRFILPSDFHIVYAEPNSIVYLRGG